MKSPAIPADEAERLATLRELLILDTPPEERFDSITAYAQSQFKVPIALVSLIDTDRQWFKSACGLDTTETPREISFCGHAILQDDIFEVTDASRDERFADNPLVTSAPAIRFYAGAPLRMANGHKIGTLCLISPTARRLDEWERTHLAELAKLVSLELQGMSATEEFALLKQKQSKDAT